MDFPRELEDTQERVGELSDAELAAMASVEENGEDIPVYHLDLTLDESTSTETAVEAISGPKLADDKAKARKPGAEQVALEHVAPEAAGRNSFGALAIRRGWITSAQLDDALLKQKETRKKLGAIFVEMRLLSLEQVAEILAEQLHLDFFDVKNYVYDPSISDLIPQRILERYTVLPLRRQGNKLFVVTHDPLDFQAIENIRLSTGLSVVPVLGLEDDIKKVLFKYFGAQAAQTALEVLAGDGSDVPTSEVGEDLSLTYNDAPIVNLVNTILESAIRDHASDIHMEPAPTAMRIRQRIDGVLHQTMTVPKKVQPLVTSRIKIMGKLNIAEKRLPQDGKIKVFVDKREVDIRLSTVPTVYGEKLVMRLLDKSRGIVPLDRLGMVDEEMSRLLSMIAAPNGVVLLTGPTGSGKTTTLYSMINEINKPDVNITTVEDPVEYQLDGLNQVNVNPKAGLTFANALRSFLRQDPDIIMVGEIRDRETAEIAVQAALTGHLVLSTIHTNDAPSTFSRMYHMGIEPFLISACMTGIISQRLVRTVCKDCAQEVEYDEDKLKTIRHFLPEGTEYHFKVGKGCNTCHQSGYKGRTAIYEVLLVTPAIREGIVAGKDTDELRTMCRHDGMKLLVECGMLKAAKGITSIEEVLRVARAEEAPEHGG